MTEGGRRIVDILKTYALKHVNEFVPTRKALTDAGVKFSKEFFKLYPDVFKELEEEGHTLAYSPWDKDKKFKIVQAVKPYEIKETDRFVKVKVVSPDKPVPQETIKNHVLLSVLEEILKDMDDVNILLYTKSKLCLVNKDMVKKFHEEVDGLNFTCKYTNDEVVVDIKTFKDYKF